MCPPCIRGDHCTCPEWHDFSVKGSILRPYSAKKEPWKSHRASKLGKPGTCSATSRFEASANLLASGGLAQLVPACHAFAVLRAVTPSPKQSPKHSRTMGEYCSASKSHRTPPPHMLLGLSHEAREGEAAAVPSRSASDAEMMMPAAKPPRCATKGRGSARLVFEKKSRKGANW